jgi:hypothetical protein
MGRKTKYSKEMCKKAEKLARQGLIDIVIAEKLGISERTFYEYQEKFPQFSQALKAGKKIVNSKVRSALLKRCLGFKYKETKVKTEGKDQSTEVTTKYLVPDVGACSLWLHNREPEEWTKNPDPITGDVKIEIEIKLFGEEDGKS